MKILAVCSGRKEGNSTSMVNYAINGIHDVSKNVEIIHLRSMDISFCDGCLSCDETGLCHIDDDMTSIIANIDKYNAFVFATPARWSLLSGDMKVFMDRLNPLAVSNKLEGKKAIIFVVGQSEEDDVDSIKTAADSVRFFCENANIEVIKSIVATDCLAPNAVLAKKNILLDCQVALEKLIDSLEKDNAG
ncbi:hypothetical protein FACS189494_02250 [Spirochaetia bacterium]|nr:hypothetical protein FACS189494_02250 [Spirochaetia bacterium]